MAEVQHDEYEVADEPICVGVAVAGRMNCNALERI
jgi:hypothetical protein